MGRRLDAPYKEIFNSLDKVLAQGKIKYRPIAAWLQSRGVPWSGDIFMKFGFYGRSKQCVYHGKHKGDQLDEQDRKTD